jgi:EpsI family protein
MKPAFKSILLMVLMLLSAGLSLSIRPTHKIADQKSPVNLETIIPESFGEWREVKQSTQQIVNPQEQKMLNEIYSQMLSRTYINAAGYRVMLSIAYGGDQSRDLQVHRPEVCYSAQGFKLSNQEKVSLQIDGRQIPVMRLQTQLGSRIEPITYWIRIGNKIVRGNLEQGFARLSYGIRGQIADGLLFRVSSIDSNPVNAYDKQERFASDLARAMLETNKPSLLGTARLIANQ